MRQTHRTLGSTEIAISDIGIGSWGWEREEADAPRAAMRHEVVVASYRAGINLIDTAELYGNGWAECCIGDVPREKTPDLVVATKFAPFRSRFLPRHLIGALRESLKRLRRERVDLYQTHWHTRPIPLAVWMSGLADAFHEGLTRAVGVSNYPRERVLRARDLLGRRGVPLASVQNEFHLLNRAAEKDGTLDAALRNNISFLAYSPLAHGLLSGKFRSSGVPQTDGSRPLTPRFRETLKDLLHLMEMIGVAHAGKTIAQVALNWVICKGAIPIHGAKNSQQAAINAGALGWQLSADEVLSLDETSDRVGSRTT